MRSLPDVIERNRLPTQMISKTNGILKENDGSLGDVLEFPQKKACNY